MINNSLCNRNTCYSPGCFYDVPHCGCGPCFPTCPPFIPPCSPIEPCPPACYAPCQNRCDVLTNVFFFLGGMLVARRC